MFKIMVLVILGTFLFGVPVYAHQRQGCVHKDPVLCQILEHSPKLDLNYASQLAHAIKAKAQLYKVPARLLTAILGAESSFHLRAIRKECGYQKDQFGRWVKQCVGKDFGIAQISGFNIKAYGYDANLLVKDLYYSVSAGAEVLRWFKVTYAKKEPKKWFLRYNCGTNKNINRKSCRAYAKAVQKWW